MIGPSHTLNQPLQRAPVAQVLIAGIAVTGAVLVFSHPSFLGLAMGCALVIAALVNFDWFFYTLIFLLPWNPTLDWKLPIRDVALVSHLVLFMGVWILRRREGLSPKLWFAGRLNKTILIFAGILVVSLVLGPPVEAGSFPAVAKMLSYILLFFSLIGWLRTPEQTTRVIQVLLVSAVLVSLFGLYQALAEDFTPFYSWLYPVDAARFEAQGGWAGRITSFLFHYNSLAGYLNVVVPVALGTTLLARGRWTRYLAFVCLTLGLAALYLTGSRGGLIAAAGMLLFSVWYLAPARKTLAVLLASILLAAAIAVPLSLKQFDQERVQSVDDFSVEARFAAWGAAGVMFLQHPVLGVGYGNYKFLVHDYVPGITEDIDAHNLYLQFLAETGVVGFAVFFVLLGAFTRIGLQLRKAAGPWCRVAGIGVCGALLATLIHGMVDFIFGSSPQFGNTFWLVLALGVVALKMPSTAPHSAPGDGTATD